MKRSLFGAMVLLLALPGPGAADKPEPIDIIPKLPADATWDIKLLKGYVKINKCEYNSERRLIIWHCTAKATLESSAAGGAITFEDEYPNTGGGLWMVKYLDEDDILLGKGGLWHQPFKLLKGKKCRVFLKFAEEKVVSKTKKIIIVPWK
jgi:hypothetical protein